MREEALSRNGRWLLGVPIGHSNVAEIWDAATGHVARSFVGHGDFVVSASFSPDGSLLLTGSSDKTARLWNVQNGTQIRVFERLATVAAAVFCPDGKCILAASLDRVVKIYDVESGTVRQTLKLAPGGQTPWISASFNSAGNRCIVAVGKVPISKGRWGYETSLYDVNNGNILTSWLASEDYSPSFSPDGKFITTIDGTSTARLIDAVSGSVIGSFAVAGEEAKNISLDPNGRRVLIEYKGRSRLFDRNSGRELRSFEGTNAFFNVDGRQIITGLPDQTARVWNADSGSLVKAIDGRDLGWKTALSRDGRYAVSHSGGASITVWDAVTWSRIRVFTGFNSRVDYSSFTPDGRILTKDKYSYVALWTLEPLALMEPGLRREEVCRFHLNGAETFSDEEMLDFVLFGRNDFRNPCSRSGPMTFAYYSNAFNHFVSLLRSQVGASATPSVPGK